MSTLVTLATRLSKSDQAPVVRMTRSFPIVGSRSVLIHAPKAADAGFLFVSMASLTDARVFIQSSDGKHLVRSSKISEPIAEFSTQAEAAELVGLLAKAVAPRRGKWVLLAIAVAFGAALMSPMPSSNSYAGANPTVGSVLRPGAARPVQLPPQSRSLQVPAMTQPVAAAGQQGLVVPQLVVPQSSAQAPLAAATASQTDVNDPFGLKVTPKP